LPNPGLGAQTNVTPFTFTKTLDLLLTSYRTERWALWSKGAYFFMQRGWKKEFRISQIFCQRSWSTLVNEFASPAQFFA